MAPDRARFYRRIVLVVGLTWVTFAMAGTGQRTPAWPDGLERPAQRVEAVTAFAEGITQNDAEAIAVGWQGRPGWEKAIAQARTDAAKAGDPKAFGLVLRRLYASYPSLHSHLTLRADVDYRTQPGPSYLPFTIKADEIGPGLSPHRAYIADVADAAVGVSGSMPRVGDEVTSIDGKPIEHWLSETAVTCRRNSRWQCFDDFDKQLRNGVLDWDPRRPLRIEATRQGRPVAFTYAAASSAIPKPPLPQACDRDGTSYDGFQASYAGWNLCVFRSATSPDTEIWRLRSFHYGPSAIVDSPKAEVERFWTSYWRKTAPTVKRLIIDVSGNGGGDIPLPWYSLIFDAPYQEQYAQYRRLKAYDDPAVANELPDDESHARWLARLRQTHPALWQSVGSYLPPVPMFCADADPDCDGLPEPAKPHGFTGRVDLILDDNCVSSCSGFSWNILTKMGSRAGAYGLPDSGDSSFMRLPMKLYWRDGRWKTAIGASSIPDERPLATANVMVTRTTTSDGEVISGKSLPVRVVIDRRWDDSHRSWADRAIRAALGGH